LADATQQGAALEPLIGAIVRNFGFDSFMYGTSAAPQLLGIYFHEIFMSGLDEAASRRKPWRSFELKL
jgi:hypothetical protein